MLLFWVYLTFSGCPKVFRTLAIGEMVEVSNDGKVVISKSLLLTLNEAQGYLANKGGPTTVGAPRTKNPITNGEGV